MRKLFLEYSCRSNIIVLGGYLLSDNKISIEAGSDFGYPKPTHSKQEGEDTGKSLPL